jgi:hypothetical protein
MTEAARTASPLATQRLSLLHVLMRQHLLLWWTRRLAFLGLLLFGSLAVLEFVVWRAQFEELTTTMLAAGMLPVLAIIGGVWALVVWREEEPARRQYHWSMPVDVTVHDLLRVLAGGSWLLVVLLAFYVTVYALAALHGDTEYLRQLGAAYFFAQVFVPLLAYLLLSVLTVGSGKPLHWLTGLYVVLVVTLLVADASNMGLERYFQAALGPERWGLAFAFTGGGPVGDAPLSAWVSSWLLWMVIATGAVVGISVAQRGRT